MGSKLRMAWDDLDVILRTFTVFGFTPMANFMNWFALTLLDMMNWFYGNVWANYGMAIIFLTLLIRMATFPLTLKSTKSMKKMQMLQPEIEKLKEECGDDQQEVQKKMMELYKERGVSPLGGCLPMFLQMPVFFAFYRMIGSAFELRHAPFMGWITDLSEPDRLFVLPFSIPLGFFDLDAFNLLPILMGIAMLVSTKLTPQSGPSQNPQQKMMMNIMPVFFSLICYNMASALNLYILTSTLLGIVQNRFVHVGDEDMKAPVKKKKTETKGRRNFYAAAQARKREAAKEARREKKKGSKPPRN
jgi:YidC/Oxa1 family membrane protein insertase